jgi:alanyl-tRNA synthetase
MQAKELLQKFFDFFEKQGHIVIPSAPLIPKDDPSVLFNIAGMQPLMPYLLGEDHPKGKRLVDVQKCIRTNDFENIGNNSHHTFFQMLGNWSLGAYFKKETMQFSYDFLTKELGLDPNKLAVTLYEGDNQVEKDLEAEKFWIEIGIPKERIAYLNAEENWWSVGDTGPCGSDTEIHYWVGSEPVPKVFNPEDSNWLELWNNVFMTYYRDEKGNLTELKNKNIDTGMGFERLLALVNKKESVYETDMFWPIIEILAGHVKGGYLQNKKELRIIVDHIRASVFLLSEGLEPSNMGRGYVLRRLIRSTIRHTKKLGFVLPSRLVCEETIKIYKSMYPELDKNREFILNEFEKEDRKFSKTLEKGLREFEKQTKDNKIDAKEAFLLFQSYGFPIEMTQELAEEKGIEVDVKGFQEEFKKHQELSRKGADKKFKGGLSEASEETIKLHTVTHILNEALRKIVSKDIKQRGSNITSERLRFDFNFDRKLEQDEKQALENEVNRIIEQGLEVKKEEMPLKQALEDGAQAEFGTKYPEKVIVYSISDYSKEICAGPHVKNTKELGKFKIKKEQSSAAGIRRIKAVLE